MARVEVVDRWEGGFTWTREREGFMQRRSHALVDARGLVWVVDPLDCEGLDDELAALGERVHAVVVLLERHVRSAESLAQRHGVPIFVPEGRRRGGWPTGSQGFDRRLPGSPFEVIAPLLDMPYGWLERALWWPQHQTLVVADCLGSVGYFLARESDPVGVHPLLRLTPPRKLGDVRPRRLLMGHGDPLTQDADAAMQRALATARSDLRLVARQAPAYLAGSARRALSRRRRRR